MAKSKAEASKGKVLASKDRDSYFTASVTQAQKDFGSKDVYVTSEHTAYGLPINNLALMWLTDMNVWPLARMTFTHGQEQSGKSAFFYWLCKLYVENGGMAVIISTENKDSPTLMKSLLGDTVDYVRYERARSTQDWQRHVTSEINNYKASPITGKFPILLGVDSLQGVIDETVQAEVLEQGFAAGRGYPVTAAATTYYLQAILDQIVGNPISLHCVNHTKTRIGGSDERGGSVTGMSSRAAGATHMRFANSLDLWFRRAGDLKPTQGRPWKGFLVNIRVNKSSFGDAHRSLEAQLCWSADKDAPGGQKTWWNWDQTTAELLGKIKTANKSGHPIFDVLKGFTENSKKYSCKTLGLTAVEGFELGAALNGDEALLKQCMEAFGIHTYTVFVPGCME